MAMASTMAAITYASLPFSKVSPRCSLQLSSSRTQRIMESLPSVTEAGGAGGSSSYAALKRLDELWLKIRTKKSELHSPPNVVESKSGTCLSTVPGIDVYDTVVCGGTLGIFVAAALALKGFKVAVIEKGRLQGRVQEWNISQKELNELVKLGILSRDNVKDVIAIDFNPNRCGFKGFEDIWVKDILNLGVSPLKLIECVKGEFLRLGGVILEGSGVSKVNVYDDTSVLTLDNGNHIYSRLVVDAMGNFSPIMRQIRSGQHPDGMCLVVGTCARGFKANSTSDVIYTNRPSMPVGNSILQCFWEAFPAGSGPADRTSYLFSYMDVKPESPSLEQMLEIYWDLMPEYQNVKLEELEIIRVLFGIFPTYRSSPLPSAFNRVLQVGDASGIQSPVSFGGFGSITRHLGRLTDGISESLQSDLLDRESLALLNPYMPNLSASWLFQKAMSVSGEKSDFINTLLGVNFQCMQKLGDPVLRPFLQDVIQFGPLAKTLGFMIFSRPDILPSIFKEVGLQPIFEWTFHFIGLGIYTFLCIYVSPLLLPWVSKLSERDQFIWRRRIDAWRYGAGLDYEL